MIKSRTRIKKAMAAASALGFSTAVSSAAHIAINFQGDWYGNEFGRDVSSSAFGIDSSDWYSSPNHTASLLDGGTDTAVIGGVNFSWTFSNDWAQVGGSYSGSTGEDEVSFGYLDDGNTGADITITGLSAWLAANSSTTYTVTLIMSTGQTGAGTAFRDTPLLDQDGGTELHLYSIGTGSPGGSGGIQGSETTGALTSDTLFVNGQTRAGSVRGSIAGIIITSNVPEPSSTALLGIAGLAFTLRRRR